MTNPLSLRGRGLRGEVKKEGLQLAPLAVILLEVLNKSKGPASAFGVCGF